MVIFYSWKFTTILCEHGIVIILQEKWKTKILTLIWYLLYTQDWVMILYNHEGQSWAEICDYPFPQLRPRACCRASRVSVVEWCVGECTFPFNVLKMWCYSSVAEVGVGSWWWDSEESAVRFTSQMPWRRHSWAIVWVNSTEKKNRKTSILSAVKAVLRDWCFINTHTHTHTETELCSNVFSLTGNCSMDDLTLNCNQC